MRKTIFLFLFLTFKLCFALTITEIMYNPEGNDSGREWIEVFNNSSETINILSGKNGWRINDGKNHLFEENLTVYPQEMFVIVQDKNLFFKDYPNFQGKVIQANFSLKNESGKIQIFDENKMLKTEIAYQNFCGGSGNGYSIFFEDNLCKENKVKGGTPGSLLVRDEGLSVFNQEETKKSESNFYRATTSATSEVVIVTSSVSIPISTSVSLVTSTEEEKETEIFKPTIIISEFLPNPSGNDQEKEYVEIYNYGEEMIDLQNFVLKIGEKKIKLKGKIEPQEYFVISNKDYSFYIRNSGEALKLYFDDQEIFSISYDSKAPEGQSFSRKEDGDWEFTEPTPGKENVFFKKKTQLKLSEQEVKASEKLAQVRALPSQKIEGKNWLFYILGSLIIILTLIFFVWFKL